MCSAGSIASTCRARSAITTGRGDCRGRWTGSERSTTPSDARPRAGGCQRRAREGRVLGASGSTTPGSSPRNLFTITTLAVLSRRIVLALLLVVSVASNAWAIEGRVVDKRTGNAISGAEVIVLGLTGSAKTDADGRFSWKPDPRPHFVILVILPDGRVSKPVR